MAKKDYLMAGEASLWVQPDGPNTEPKFLGCHMVGDLTVPKGDKTLRYCPDPARAGKYKKAFSFRGEPGPVTTSITTFLKKTADWLEIVAEQDCPVAVYIHKVTCGRRDVFTSFDRSFDLYPADITNENYTALASREPGDEAPSEYATDISGDEMYRPRALTVARQSIAETTTLNDIAFCNQKKCADSCGVAADLGESGWAVGEAPSGSPAAHADTWHTYDGGGAWTSPAAHPFDAGEDLMSEVCFQVGKGTTRKLVAREADPANPMEIAYSDDDGATWTRVTVGTVVNQGAMGQGALFALDMYHIWLVVNDGYIFFSGDGGLTWTPQEEGVATVQDLWAVWFSDENNGLAVGAAGVVLYTIDGGTTWSVGGIPVAAILGCVTDNAGGAIWWVGASCGDLYFSNDQGLTWAQRAFGEDGVGSVRDIQFSSPLDGFMIHDNATLVGAVWQTIDGGYDWSKLTTPTNTGLRALAVLSENLAFAVGRPSGGTAVVLKVSG
jgi:hypothetical protein